MPEAPPSESACAASTNPRQLNGKYQLSSDTVKAYQRLISTGEDGHYGGATAGGGSPTSISRTCETGRGRGEDTM